MYLKCQAQVVNGCAIERSTFSSSDILGAPVVSKTGTQIFVVLPYVPILIMARKTQESVCFNISFLHSL